MKKGAKGNKKKKDKGSGSQEPAVPSFTLKQLMDLRPCNDGLANALKLFKSHRAVVGASREFWKHIDVLGADGWGDDEQEVKDARRKVRQMQDGIRIIAKPSVFIEQLKDGDTDFQEYSLKLLGRQGRNAWRRRVYDKLKDELAKANVKCQDNAIEACNERIAYLKTQLKQEQQHLDDIIAVKSKRKPPSLDGFDAEEFLNSYNDLGQDATDLTIAEFVAALHERLRQV